MRLNPFRRRGGEKAAPKAPSSGLGPGVTGPAGAGEAQPAPKRGLLGRMFGRKPKPAPAPKPKAEEPPEVGGPAPAAPEGAGPAGGPEGAEAKPPRTYPSTLPVSASGWWKISDTDWNGTAHGTLTGIAVRQYIDALEAGNLDLCIYLIAEAYDDGSDFARHLDIAGSAVEID